MEINTKILKIDKECYDETLKEYKEKIGKKEQEKNSTNRDISNLNNEISLVSTQYYDLLKDYQEKLLQANSLDMRLKSVRDLKTELEKNMKKRKKYLKYVEED